MPQLQSEFIFTFSVGVTRAHDLGPTPFGVRHIDMLGAGTFEGPDIKGKVLPGGIDCKLLRGDGVAMPNVRLVFETDDGTLILARYAGLRHGPPEVMERIAAGEPVDPGACTLRIALTFETGSEKYNWLNRTLAVGVGRRMPDHAEYDVFAVL
jgi:hypothetical protein